MRSTRDCLPVESLSLIIPALNEEDTIGNAIDEASLALRKLASSYEIIVVDDGSRDRTAAHVVQKARANASVRLVSHDANRGYGAAIRSGFAAARSSLVAFTDADCQFHLEDLGLLLAYIPNHEVVCGYRLDRSDTWLRRFYSTTYNRVVRRLLGVVVRDCDCALKVFRASALDDLAVETDGFLVNAEILAKLRMQGARLTEVGVRHRPRLAGHSTVSVFHMLPVVMALVRFWWSWVLFPPRHVVLTSANPSPTA